MIVSPCKKICKIVDTVCIGCGRTLEEITMWTKYNDSMKKEVKRRAELRLNDEQFYNFYA